MLNYLRNIMVPLESPLDGQHDTHLPHQKSNQKEFWYFKKKKKFKIWETDVHLVIETKWTETKSSILSMAILKHTKAH